MPDDPLVPGIAEMSGFTDALTTSDELAAERAGGIISDARCPFYGVALVVPDRGRRFGSPVLMRSSGNQCGLITSAHSPCWMQVEEERAPDWLNCPRNPEWAAIAIYDIDRARVARHNDHLRALMGRR